MHDFDVAIVGAGIIGLAHAYVARQQGLRVVVFERNPQATGASVRNFGLLWPIGQPAGERHSLAMRSREIWLEVLQSANLPYYPTGSLHVARTAAEQQVLQEFAEIGPDLGYPCEWLDAASTLGKSAAVRPDGLAGALHSPTEITVDPRLTITGLASLLASTDVQFCFNTAVTAIEGSTVVTPGKKWHAERIFVCNGDDFSTLFPDLFAQSGITRCKLQMLRTVPQPRDWKLGPALAGGLTLRFYQSFRICPSLPTLAEQFARQMPEYERWGIHVMASQGADGSVTLGDSHEYGNAVDIFDKTRIDDLILQYLQTFCVLPDLRIAQRWHGVYGKHPDLAYFRAKPEPGVHIVTGTGGAGMTLSFGIADESFS
ncbi:MAG: TIGR03364 family FAD-dependent oxidoreductase [Bryobacteraceae bacterium]|nr:TIGR03364 family FAD-dependent oxidoreductase [Bryobacteraceae bacterium]